MLRIPNPTSYGFVQNFQLIKHTIMHLTIIFFLFQQLGSIYFEIQEQIQIANQKYHISM